jgi:hypothetical protein
MMTTDEFFLDDDRSGCVIELAVENFLELGIAP